MSALEGVGVLQDRFKIGGKGRCLLFATPVRAEAGSSLENFGHWGPKVGRGHPERAGRPRVEFGVLGGKGPGVILVRDGRGPDLRRVLNGEGAGRGPIGSRPGAGGLWGPITGP